MTQRRVSKRHSAITKRRLLEDKLNKRKVEAEIRCQRNRSKLLQRLHEAELKSFLEEALRLSQTVDRLLLTSCSDSNLSVDSLELTVNEIIDNIQNLDKSSGNKEALLDSPPTSTNRTRRRQTTDPDFLEDRPVDNPQRTFPHPSWPPRYPSQEPEEFIPLEHSSIVASYHPFPSQETLSEGEVFEEDSEPENTEACLETIFTDKFQHLFSSSSPPLAPSESAFTMEEQTFTKRNRFVKVAERKVKDTKKTFLAQDFTEIDLNHYNDRLKEIRDRLEGYNDIVTELVLDLNPSSKDDEERIATLEADKETLLIEVLNNEKEVKEKVKNLLAEKPLSKAEQDNLDLKLKQMKLTEDKENKALTEKSQKAELYRLDILAKAIDLHKKVAKVKSAEDLSDQEVREHLSESKRWESKLDDISCAKLMLDTELIGIQFNANGKVELLKG